MLISPQVGPLLKRHTLVPCLRPRNTQWHEIKGAGETVKTLRVPTSPQGEHSLAESRHDHWWRLPDVYVGAKNSAGFPITCWNKRPVGLSSFVNCPPVVASFVTQRQLSINAGWQHMGRVPHPNYVDPECCVATVCHQVRFMYWEHLGHIQRAISHLKWHEIVCMRYLACTFSQMKSTDMFSMYLQSGVPRHFIQWFIVGWT